MPLQRFMRSDDFIRELKPLRAFGDSYISTALLEDLESADLLLPRIRIRYPDNVARRFWLETHAPDTFQLKLGAEPDGPRWDAAVDLFNALYVWRNSHTNRPPSHPLDEPESRFVEFIQQPKDFVFQRLSSRRVDVSSDVYDTLFSDCNFEDYYTSWQVLLAAEIADAGIHLRVNLANEDLADVIDGLRHGRIPKNSSYSLNIGAIHAARDFSTHGKALDACVWFAEEREHVLTKISDKHHKRGERRFLLASSEREEYEHTKKELARTSLDFHHVGENDLTELIRFLAKHWSKWDREGRPLIAAAYKRHLEAAVVLTQYSENLAFNDLRDRVGRVDGRFKPILDVIWPNWSEEEKERARLTLKGATGTDKPGKLEVTEDDIFAFVSFLSENGHEAFFWRLRSFESHAIRGNEFALQGMKSDIQGMAIVVEHIAQTLGSTAQQLYEKFKQLWRDPEILRILKRDDVSKLARNGKQAKDWFNLKIEIDSLRNELGGHAAADLVMTHRIRGGVHLSIGEDNPLELEAIFVCLMRAAIRTFLEVRRNASMTLE